MSSKANQSKQAPSVDGPVERIAPKLRGLVVPIGSVQPDPANVRTHGPRNIETIKASLLRFGQQKPIVVDADGVVVAGNGTLVAARGLGWNHIAVVESELVGADRIAYAIADNRTAELAEWDDSALADQLRALAADGTIDHLVTGFSDLGLEKLFDGLNQPSDSSQRPEPEVPECFQVVVECESEDHQRRLYERLTKEGLTCRLLML